MQELWDEQYNCVYYYDPKTGRSSYTKEDLVPSSQPVEQSQQIEPTNAPPSLQQPQIYDSSSEDDGSTSDSTPYVPLQQQVVQALAAAPDNADIKEMWDDDYKCAYYYEPKTGRTSYVYADLLKPAANPDNASIAQTDQLAAADEKQTTASVQAPSSPADNGKGAYWDLDSSDGVEELWVSLNSNV